MNVVDLDPRRCKRWEFADRSIYDFGDIISLSQDIIKHGQIEPVILRKCQSEQFDYEVIAGSRRLQACQNAGIPLKGIVQNLTDEQAIIAQVKENQKISLSDYSKGLSYAHILEEKKISLTRLANILGLSRIQLNRFLCFKKIPDTIWEAIGNPSKISARTVETMHGLARRGKPYIHALVESAETLRNGAGSRILEKAVMHHLQGQANCEKTITLSSGQIIATWVKSGLQFSKDVTLDPKDIEKLLIGYFSKQKRL